MPHPCCVRCLLGALGALGVAATALFAQETRGGESRGTADQPPADARRGTVPQRVLSLGQPKGWSWLVGAAAWGSGSSALRADPAQLRFATYHSIANPVVDALGVSLEAYSGFGRGSAMTFGARARLTIPVLGLAVGADRDFENQRTNAIYSVRAPLRRGGVIGRGSMFRADYLPGRGNQWYVGIEAPLRRRVDLGRVRPASDRATTPATMQRATTQRAATQHATTQDATTQHATAHAATVLDASRPTHSLSTMRREADVIRRHVVPFLGREVSGASTRATARAAAPTAAVDLAAAITRYHDAIDSAFPGAMPVATLARETLLSEVILPYDRLLGQAKAPQVMPALVANAHRSFRISLEEMSFGDAGQRAVWRATFAEMLEVVDEQRRAIVQAWRDERFAWIPLQFALRANQHDTQEELDALLTRAVETQFTDGNFVSYVINEQFQYQLSRTIRAAEDYHVLWTHDFRGVDDVGNPDEVSYRQVVRSYLAAMTARVRAYDSTGSFPTYLILHDQWYYSVRQGSLFLKFLEDPTRATVKLPREFRAWSDTIHAAQAELNAAIRGSRRLQDERLRYGEEWIRNLIKVHVSVMNQPDPSYRSWRLVAGLPMTDNILRDHRKLIFYDVSEADPYRGEAIYTGAGVGEHYSNLTWEDRSILVRGPAALDLKNQARLNLLAHRLPLERLPRALHPQPLAADYAARVQEGRAQSEVTLRALSVHNETGYDAKRVNVAKALLYTMMPSGSVILVPDSFWNAEFWGSALYGAALRGSRVLIIAPSYRSNSVEVRGTQLLSRELLWRILSARERDATTLAQSGGMIQVGIFDSEVDVTDIPAKVRNVRNVFANTAWLRELFGFPDAAYADLARLEEEIAALSMTPGRPREFEHDDRTRLHLKANYFASREAWTIMQRPEWGQLTWSFVTQRIAQVQSRTESVMRMEETPDALLEIGTGFVRDWQQSVPAADRARVVFYHMMGSQNQNYRSMVMDAEVAFVTAGWPSVIPYLDALALIGQSEWMQRPEDLNAKLPPMGALMSFVAHWGRLAF
jgi:phosphatidylserine/phosphatidylglycerophosphate/cardiolipin synthase-like enzyme